MDFFKKLDLENQKNIEGDSVKSDEESMGVEIVFEGIKFPEKVSKIEKSYMLGGSSGVMAGYYEDQLFAIKTARFAETEEKKEQMRDQLIEESIADDVYLAMGFPVPEAKLYGDGDNKVSKFVEGKDLNAIDFNEHKKEDIKKELQKGFVLDCLLANWDVIGACEDNIRLGSDGKLYRLDNGGSLRFRARGELKGDKFGGEVGELDRLRKKQEWFNDITDEEIANQIDIILKDQDKIFDILIQKKYINYSNLRELKEILIQRLDYLKKYRENLRSEEKEDKGEYESVVTKKYFENWDDLELEGNPELKETIKKNIIEAEIINKSTYEDCAKKLGISVEEFKQKLQERVEDIVRKSNFFKATRESTLRKVLLEDGRWKSQFEVGKSSGTFDMGFRSAVENEMFGFVKDVKADKEKRPIYAFFSDGPNGEINNEGTIPPPSSVLQYGSVHCKIKKEVVLRRATITFQDSLGDNDESPPAPAIKPHFTALRFWRHDILEKMVSSSKKDWGDSYTEIQVHKQLTAEDIESIHISPGNNLYSIDEEEIKERNSDVEKVVAEYNRKNQDHQIKLIKY